jgi:hypothetical protein
MVPLHIKDDSKRSEEWVDVFLRGLLMYWPFQKSSTSITLLVDSEISTDAHQRYIDTPIRVLSKDFQSNFPSINIKYNYKREGVYRSGHDRQQYLMFYADNFTNSSYVGFMDTDTLVHSYVLENDIFEDEKPIIHGYIVNYNQTSWLDSFYISWAKNTYHALGLEEPMICMSYFPIVIKTNHLIEIRQFIMNHFKVNNFDDAFRLFAINTGLLY